jgi:hypothetical protein
VAVVQRMAVVQRLVQNTRLSYTRFSRAGDSGRPLLTGGRCSEVTISTGLTVQSNLCTTVTLGNQKKWPLFISDHHLGQGSQTQTAMRAALG